MKRGHRTALGVSLAAVLLLGIVLCTGLYAVPKSEPANSCDTCAEIPGTISSRTPWCFRSGRSPPFISFDGGMRIRYNKAGLSLFERVGRASEHRESVQRRTILRLSYLRVLYPLSAEGRSPQKYGEAL